MSERYGLGSESERDDAVNAARDALARGELAVVPTDTVYGLAADAFEAGAVDRLRSAKGRGRDMPPPVLVASPTTLDALATALPTWVRDVVDAHWPGPLTVVCHQQPSLTWDLGDARETVAVRVPDHPVLVALLKQTGPLAVSSANLTGYPPADDVDAAVDMLGDSVAVYLDDGPASGGPASTILDVTSDPPRVLREGALSVRELREIHAAIVGPDDDDLDDLDDLDVDEDLDEVDDLDVDEDLDEVDDLDEDDPDGDPDDRPGDR